MGADAQGRVAGRCLGAGAGQGAEHPQQYQRQRVRLAQVLQFLGGLPEVERVRLTAFLVRGVFLQQGDQGLFGVGGDGETVAGGVGDAVMDVGGDQGVVLQDAQGGQVGEGPAELG